MLRLSAWRETARRLKRDVLTLYFVCNDPRTPWYAKAFAAAVVAYALSPIDLIPDAIPVLGYLDELVLLPLAVTAILWMVPVDLLAECRVKAERLGERPVSKVGAAMIVAIWLLVAAAVGYLVFKAVSK